MLLVSLSSRPLLLLAGLEDDLGNQGLNVSQPRVTPRGFFVVLGNHLAGELARRGQDPCSGAAHGEQARRLNKCWNEMVEL